MICREAGFHPGPGPRVKSGADSFGSCFRETAVIDLKTIRTDVVGSLLRPQNLKEARVAFDEGRIDENGIRTAEDAAVAAAVRLQESAGLDVISDGEMRRLNFQD